MALQMNKYPVLPSLGSKVKIRSIQQTEYARCHGNIQQEIILVKTSE
jgi:hypothetical protein